MIKALIALVVVVLVAVIVAVVLIIADAKPSACEEDPACSTALTLDVQHEVERRQPALA